MSTRATQISQQEYLAALDAHNLEKSKNPEKETGALFGGLQPNTTPDCYDNYCLNITDNPNQANVTLSKGYPTMSFDIDRYVYFFSHAGNAYVATYDSPGSDQIYYKISAEKALEISASEYVK